MIQKYGIVYLTLTKRYSLAALDIERRVGQPAENENKKRQLLLDSAIFEGDVSSLLDGYRSWRLWWHQRRARVNVMVARSSSTSTQCPISALRV